MAYTSIIPVSRLDNSITYIRNKDKTTKKGQSAGSLEEAIDYAMNRDKTERSVFEDAIGYHSSLTSLHVSFVMRSISRILSSPAIPQPLATWAS